jgi:CO/xanthine dehydrogenase FAD-binding subunit
VSNYLSSSVTSPDSLEQALKLLDQEADRWQIVAGGTDLMVTLPESDTNRKFLNLSKLTELKGVTVTDQFIIIGALTTFDEIANHPVITSEFPLLSLAAREVGAKAIQNRATLGGNLVNASPAADAPVALLCYPCKVGVTSKTQTHWVSYEKFHLNYRQVALGPSELLSKVRLARTPQSRAHYFYRKVGSRQALAISKIALASHITMESNGSITSARIALGAVAATPMRALKSEKLLEGSVLTSELISQVVETMGEEISPIDDLRSTAIYRGQVAANLLTHFLNSLLPLESE